MRNEYISVSDKIANQLINENKNTDDSYT